MFSSDIKEKLIKELNIQLENGSFYMMNNVSDYPENREDVEQLENISYSKTPSFAGIAKITGTDFGIQNDVSKNSITNNAFSNYLSTIKSDTSKLYKPMINTFSNPLEKSAFSYKATFDVRVNGMAFLSNNGGIVENPLSKHINIVNNITAKTPGATTTQNKNTITKDSLTIDLKNANKEQTSEDGTRLKIEPIAMNTYNMLDILNEAGAADELIFEAIPKEYALTTISKWNWRNILFKEINIIESIKKIFSMHKIK